MSTQPRPSLCHITPPPLKKMKGKEEYFYSAILVRTHTLKAPRHGSHSFTCKQHHACLSFVSVHVHQMAPPQLRQRTPNCSLLLIYRPRKDERLSWPSWLTYSGWFTHISGHPSATGRAQDSESSPAKDQRYTAVPHNQLIIDMTLAFCAILLPLTHTHGKTWRHPQNRKYIIYCNVVRGGPSNGPE